MHHTAEVLRTYPFSDKHTEQTVARVIMLANSRGQYDNTIWTP